MGKVEKRVRFKNIPDESGIPDPSSAKLKKEYYYPILTEKKSFISSLIEWTENLPELEFQIQLFKCLGLIFTNFRKVS